jgi:hypothetical protein
MGRQPRSGDIPWLTAHSILNWIGGDISMVTLLSRKSRTMCRNLQCGIGSVFERLRPLFFAILPASSCGRRTFTSPGRSLPRAGGALRSRALRSCVAPNRKRCSSPVVHRLRCSACYSAFSLAMCTRHPCKGSVPLDWRLSSLQECEPCGSRAMDSSKPHVDALS